MNLYCKLVFAFGVVGMLCSWLAVALAAKARREYWKAKREYCKWCGRDKDGGFEE